MPPKSKPSSSHSSRPSSHSSSHSHSSPSHSSSSHSSHSSHSSSSHHSGGFGSGPRPPHHGGGFGAPPRPRRRPYHRSRSYGYSDYDNYGPGFGPRYTVGQCCGTVLIILIILAVAVFVFIKYRNSHQPQNDPPAQIEMQDTHEDIYVPALERKVSWNTEYECYYDQQTDCYFFKNEDVEPPIWQYWFETVSAEYGDYGWMEWDEKEQKWYIETGESKWEKLPEDKYSNYLWHFD